MKSICLVEMTGVKIPIAELIADDLRRYKVNGIKHFINSYHEPAHIPIDNNALTILGSPSNAIYAAPDQDALPQYLECKTTIRISTNQKYLWYVWWLKICFGEEGRPIHYIEEDGIRYWLTKAQARQLVGSDIDKY